MDDRTGIANEEIRVITEILLEAPKAVGIRSSVLHGVVSSAPRSQVALYRTWDISLGYTIASGKLNLALSGVFLLLSPPEALFL